MKRLIFAVPVVVLIVAGYTFAVVAAVITNYPEV